MPGPEGNGSVGGGRHIEIMPRRRTAGESQGIGDRALFLPQPIADCCAIRRGPVTGIDLCPDRSLQGKAAGFGRYYNGSQFPNGIWQIQDAGQRHAEGQREPEKKASSARCCA